MAADETARTLYVQADRRARAHAAEGGGAGAIGQGAAHRTGSRSRDLLRQTDARRWLDRLARAGRGDTAPGPRRGRALSRRLHNLRRAQACSRRRDAFRRFRSLYRRCPARCSATHQKALQFAAATASCIHVTAWRQEQGQASRACIPSSEQAFASDLEGPQIRQRQLSDRVMLMQDIDFLIIGATKSATTWLQRSLQADPLVSMPDPELHYFSREFGRGDDWYLSQFPPNAPALSSRAKNPTLTWRAREAADRIASKLPNVKLVVQLRNPVERAYSDYCMMYRRGEVGRDIERYLDPRRFASERKTSERSGFTAASSGLLRPLPAGADPGHLLRDDQDAAGAAAGHRQEIPGTTGRESAAHSQPRSRTRPHPCCARGCAACFARLKPVVAPFRSNPYFRKVHAALATEISYSPFPDGSPRAADRSLCAGRRGARAPGRPRLVGMAAPVRPCRRWTKSETH